MTAHLLDATGKETGETIKTYIYHRLAKNVKQNEPVPNGDWL